MEIKSYNEFKTDDPKRIYEFKATVLDIINEGNQAEKWPLRFKVLMEDSGETAEIVSWDYQYLLIAKNAVSDNNIYEVEVNAKLFKDVMNLRLVNLRKTESISSRKQKPGGIEAVSESVESELKEIAQKYIRNPICKGIVDKVLTEYPEFYTRPAAVRIHHAYPGGLAEHTLGVTKIAINLYRTYSEYCSLDLLITGAIIHDIGKVIEYADDSKISYEGGFNTHITYGISMLTTFANEMNLPATDPIIMQLIGIVASHHNLLEYGSPSRPATPEAMLVSFADQIDAGMKGAIEAIVNLPEGAKTDPIKSLGGAKFTVINNKKLFRVDLPSENSGEK